MAKRSFEESLERLEQITEELEGGNLSLEESLKKFDEG
ncbi:MAG TPA: exodeoxyribonuclease VII small subunit, partial [Desulfurivibrionaceae bacterium]|nr:exodeoxyribonuclease VII small subunit [Desulfurivibrionaceae bacterium]